MTMDTLTERPVVMVIGATGLFGGFLARRLIREQRFNVIGTARTAKNLDAFSNETGVTTEIVNRDDIRGFKDTLSLHKPFAVVDCAGPFQYYGADAYRPTSTISSRCVASRYNDPLAH